MCEINEFGIFPHLLKNSNHVVTDNLDYRCFCKQSFMEAGFHESICPINEMLTVGSHQ